MPRGLSLDEAHRRRGHELATVVSDPDRRCVLKVIDGRTRRRPGALHALDFRR
jgi:transposase